MSNSRPLPAFGTLALTSSLVAAALTVGNIAFAEQLKGPDLTLSFPSKIVDLIVDPVTHKVYLSREDGIISVLDSKTNKVIANFTVPGHLFSYMTIAKSDRLYAVDNGSKISAIDTSKSMQIENTTKIGVNMNLLGINPNTDKLYAVSAESGSILVMNLSTRALIANITDYGSPCSLAINSKTDNVYLANCKYFYDDVLVIDGHRDKVIDNIVTGDTPNGVAINPITNRIYVANSFSNNTIVLDGSTNEKIGSIETKMTPKSVDIDANNNLVYIANEGSDTISVVNGTNNEIINTILVNTSPEKVAINQQTGQAFVTHLSEPSISVLTGAGRSNNIGNINDTYPTLTIKTHYLTPGIMRASMNPERINITLSSRHDGNAIALNATVPESKFLLKNGEEYNLGLSDITYGNYSAIAPFHNWKDTGSTARQRTISIDNDVQLTASYTGGPSGCDSCNSNFTHPKAPNENQSILYVDVNTQEASNDKTVLADSLTLTDVVVTLSQNDSVINSTGSAAQFYLNNGESYEITVPKIVTNELGRFEFDHWRGNYYSRNVTYTFDVPEKGEKVPAEIMAIYKVASTANETLLQKLNEAQFVLGEKLAGIPYEELPISAFTVDEGKLTLAVMIDDRNATLPKQAYVNKLQDLLGKDIPIDISFGHVTLTAAKASLAER